MQKLRFDFEDFLEDKFIDNIRDVEGVSVTNKNYEDLFCKWSQGLHGEEYIRLANEYGKWLIKRREEYEFITRKMLEAIENGGIENKDIENYKTFVKEEKKKI